MRFPLIADSPSIEGKIENILLEEGISELERNGSDANSVSKDSEFEIEENLPLMLIVEDNFDMQQFLKASFENQYRIMQAFKKQGLEKAIDNFPNIILCDVMMPEMDGIEF